jgi:methionyl-tRNA formyltransferase
VIDPQKLRTVFMGTPEFALPSLAGLMEIGVDLRAVFTSPIGPAAVARN